MRRGVHFEEADLTKERDYKMAGRLLPFLSPHRNFLFLALVLVVILTGLELSIPWITKEAVDRYIVPDATRKETRLLRVAYSDPAVHRYIDENPEQAVRKEGEVFILRDALKTESAELASRLRKADRQGVFRQALFLLSALFGILVFGFLQTLVLETMGQRIIFDLRMTLFSHVRKLPLSWFHANPTGRIVTRLTGDVENLREMFTSVITFVFKDIFLIVGILGMLFSLDIPLAGVIFAIVPIIVFTVTGFSRSSREVFRQLRLKIAEINARLAESIGGMSVIRLFSRERETDAGFRELSRQHFAAGMKQVRIFAVFMPVIEVLAATALGMVIFFGGWRVLGEGTSLGVLVAYISYIRMFFRPVRDIAEKYNILQNAFASTERLFLILDTPIAEDEKKGGKIPGKMESLEFSKLTFGYDAAKPVLEGVDLAVGRGETIAIVGPTGAGKTSIVSLLVRFWDPQKGEIRINGIPLPDLDSADWRSRMAMVMQDPFLFAGSIADNVLPEEGGLSDDVIESTLRNAGCGFVLDRLEHGLHTELTEGGSPLSSGERQLVSIARAFFRNPELLILDEATSYVDSVSEAEIQAALFRLMEDRTTFLIAHRLSTARGADRILVVKGGRIVESGNHDALMNKKGIYFRMQLMENGKNEFAK